MKPDVFGVGQTGKNYVVHFHIFKESFPMRRLFCSFIIAGLLLVTATIASAGTFKVGVARRDITPQKPIPMWGYGARHALPGTYARDNLFAKVLVIDVGESKAALVGLDLGRSPTFAMMELIEKEVKEKAGVDYVLAVGSHTHHGPAIELLDEPGMGKGKYDDAVAYAQQLPHTIVDAIVEAAGKVVDARMGIAVEETDFNRNRHAKREPKPKDPRLSVVRFDGMDGKPIAVMVNLGAHATIESVFQFHWTSEWPGHMQMTVERELGGQCFFMQGAEGDMSPNTREGRQGIDGFGKAVGEKVIEMAKAIETTVPAAPSLKGMTEKFTGPSRLDLTDKTIVGALKQGFFPEMLALTVEMPDNQVTVRMDTLLINNDLAIVGGSGELFSEISNRIKAQSAAPHTLVFGCCNGHSMYVPTLEGIEQGGYGADPLVAWTPAGTAEKMIDKAVENIAALMKN